MESYLKQIKFSEDEYTKTIFKFNFKQNKFFILPNKQNNNIKN
jgi:hypothetical protein